MVFSCIFLFLQSDGRLKNIFLYYFSVLSELAPPGAHDQQHPAQPAFFSLPLIFIDVTKNWRLTRGTVKDKYTHAIQIHASASDTHVSIMLHHCSIYQVSRLHTPNSVVPFHFVTILL